MGYSTDFDGEFTCTPALNQAQVAYLQAFASSRRMKRDPTIASNFPDPLRNAVGLCIGAEGDFYVGGAAQDCGQAHDSSVLDYNKPPAGQPGLWVQWEPSEDGAHIRWDGGEKFYNYVEWLEYYIQNFFIPWGITLNGTVRWRGEDFDDVGTIEVEDNVVTVSNEFHGR